MNSRKVIIVLGLFLLTCGMVMSQVTLVSIHCDSLPFPEFVKELEKTTPLKVFYNPNWTDSIKVSVDVKDQLVTDVLNAVLNGTDLSFILTNGRIMLSRAFKVKTDYSQDVRNAYASYEDVKYPEKIEYKPPARETEEPVDINPEYQLFRIGNPAIKSQGEEAVISGYITDRDNGEPLIGAVVYLEDHNIGAATNTFGFYSIQLPKGQFTLEYRYVGMKTTSRNIQLYSDGSLNMEMEEEIVPLQEVTITTEGQQYVRSTILGMEKISIRQIKDIPMALGEVDILRSLTLLPGVQTVGEGTTGFNVRGGSADQNLILLDGAPIMNPSHFVGFFSSLNADLMKDAILYKSSIPAQYGGRISSVLDLQTREGNKKEIAGSGGIGPVTARIMLEGPVVKDKVSFLLGARSTYSNWLLQLLKDEKLKRSSIRFRDVNGKLTIDLNEKNSLYGSGYYSRDYFHYLDEIEYSYSNVAATLTWKNVLTNRLFSLYSLVYSKYRYETVDLPDTSSSSELGYSIEQYKADLGYTWYPLNGPKVQFGLNSIWYNISPGSLRPHGPESLIKPVDLETEHALETALFCSGEYDLTPGITLSAGLRLSSFLVFGPATEYQYLDPENRSLETISDTLYYAQGELVRSSIKPEPRISLRISLNSQTSVKLGYTRMAQYLHMLSNTTAIAPTDTWTMSDAYLLPQVGDQYGAGLYRNFGNNSVETSLELYYRRLKNIIDYKGGAELVMNEHIETDVLNGTGKAYGAELMVRRIRGKLTGWISYSHSRIFHKIESTNWFTSINRGRYFPANYDKPNSLSLVGNYRVSRRISISTTIDYSDGRPVTFPIASFYYMGAERFQYARRNDYRIPEYFRWDLSVNLEGNLKVNKLAHSSLTLGVYNVTGRNNTYSVFFRSEQGQVKGYKLSVFGQPIPTVTYNFRF